MSAPAPVAVPLAGDRVPAVMFDGRQLIDAAAEQVIATLGDDDIWRTPDGTPTTGLDLPIVRVAATVTPAARATRDRAADEDWLRNAIEDVRALAATTLTFTTDEVWGVLRFPPREGRQLGPLMLACEREKIIARTDEYRPSTRRINHGRPQQVWRSLLTQPIPRLFP